jgi:hypothetical protein
MGTVTTSVGASAGRGGTGKGVAINRGRQNPRKGKNREHS